METKKIIKNLLEVITFDKDFNASDYDDWGIEMEKMVTDWVTKNNVENVEFTVASDRIFENYHTDADNIKNLTPFKVNEVNNDFDIARLAEKHIIDGEGPGWDPELNEITQWNDEYFYTGADTAFYILIHKI